MTFAQWRKAVRARLDAATPGPWKHHYNGGVYSTASEFKNAGGNVCVVDLMSDLPFITNALTDLKIALELIEFLDPCSEVLTPALNHIVQKGSK